MRRSPSKLIEKDQDHQRDMSPHVVTRMYRAPELILLDSEYDQSIDVYSMGCILFELMNTLMLKEKGGSIKERFYANGSSCYPLSPIS